MAPAPARVSFLPSLGMQEDLKTQDRGRTGRRTFGCGGRPALKNPKTQDRRRRPAAALLKLSRTAGLTPPARRPSSSHRHQDSQTEVKAPGVEDKTLKTKTHRQATRCPAIFACRDTRTCLNPSLPSTSPTCTTKPRPSGARLPASNRSEDSKTRPRASETRSTESDFRNSVVGMFDGSSMLAVQVGTLTADAGLASRASYCGAARRR